jgi:hypothetical protein
MAMCQARYLYLKNENHVGMFMFADASRSEGRGEPIKAMLRVDRGALGEINKRIAQCRDTARSNCIGTALYIAGEQGEDVKRGASAADKCLLDMRAIEKPVVGCLVAWKASMLSYDEEFPLEVVLHMGVVTSLDPILIANRVSGSGPFIENQRLEDAGTAYSHEILRTRVVFYLPKALLGAAEQGT